MNLEEKKQIVEDLKDRFKRSKVLIVTDYKGLDVASINDLRRKLTQAGVEYRVVKNTLLERASADTDVAAISDAFTGPSAVAFSYDDPVAPAKVLIDFAKDNKKLEIKSGVMDGKVLTAESIKALSSLPSREELLAQLLSVFNQVPTSFVRVLNAVPSNFVNVLSALKDKKAAA